MNIFKIKIGPREKEILKHIGLSTLLVTFIFAPKASEILKLFPELNTNKKKDFNKYKYQAKRIIKRLEEKNVIYLSSEKVQLTAKGKKLIKLFDLDKIKIKRPKKWDKKWRLVAYDIPDSRKTERDFFRFKISNLGFIKIQKSLWTIPFECKEEIAVISQCVGVSPFVIYLTADYLPNEQKILKRFFS